MKEYLLKREAVFRLSSLLLVVASVFINDLNMKMALVVLGILGLILVSWAKGQKVVVWIFTILLVAAGVVYYYSLHPEVFGK